MNAPPKSPPLLEKIAAYALVERQRKMSENVAHHVKRAVIDWFAALFAGSGLPPGPQLARAHEAELGLSCCSLPVLRTTTIPATAAWINGSMSHAAEFDDIYRDAVYHPGCPTIAAALAAAEFTGASGSDFLSAVLIGYEISTRIGAAIQPSHYRFFHTTGTVGCLGAAAAATSLLAPGNFDAMVHGLATSATFASGLQQAFRSDSMTKALHAGHAAAVGIYAAQAAAQGVTGARDILEGPAGFGAALAENPDWTAAFADLGLVYNVTRITQKKHACCGHTFAAIDAALVLRQSINAPLDELRSIRIETYQTALDVAGNADPATSFEAKFSLPYTVCHALVHGTVRMAAFEPARLGDPVVRELMRRVVLHADPDFTDAFPRARAARVQIVDRQGNVHEHFSPFRKGDPESPLTDSEIDEKFRELALPVLGRKGAARLLQELWDLDRIAVRSLTLV